MSDFAVWRVGNLVCYIEDRGDDPQVYVDAIVDLATNYAKVAKISQVELNRIKSRVQYDIAGEFNSIGIFRLADEEEL